MKIKVTGMVFCLQGAPGYWGSDKCSKEEGQHCGENRGSWPYVGKMWKGPSQKPCCSGDRELARLWEQKRQCCKGYGCPKVEHRGQGRAFSGIVFYLKACSHNLSGVETDQGHLAALLT